jgi:hypothetical protein
MRPTAAPIVGTVRRAASEQTAFAAPATAGQASVELVALLPLAVLVSLTIAQFLAAGAAQETAGNAAEAGAVAILQGTDPAAAVRAALPGWSRDRTTVQIARRRVEVRVRPRAVVPLLADHLEAVASADAGPAT